MQDDIKEWFEDIEKPSPKSTTSYLNREIFLNSKEIYRQKEQLNEISK
jgi:hypothetical protein